jgi:hypothetical protein
MVFYKQTVRILNPVYKENRAGDRELDRTATLAQQGLPWERVQLRPIAQYERLVSETETGVSQWRVASRPGSPDVEITSASMVRLPTGDVCSVVGEPSRPTSPLNGKLDHVEVLLERAAVQ